MRTQQLLMRVAPHRSLPSPWEDFKRSATCHGQPPLQSSDTRWSGYSSGELRQLLSSPEWTSCWLSLTDTAYLQNVLFINGAEYFYILAALRIPFNKGPLTLQRVWASSTLSASSHSQLFEFSVLRFHSLGQKYILWVPRQILSKSTNQKFPVNWRGERGISWKAELSIHPCLHEKGSWQTKRSKATVELSSIDEHLFSACDYLVFIVDRAIFAGLWIQDGFFFAVLID